MNALKDLLSSEKGLLALVLIIAVSVLAFTDRIDPQQWMDYTTWIFIGHAGGTGLRAVGTGLAQMGTKRTPTGGDGPEPSPLPPPPQG